MECNAEYSRAGASGRYFAALIERLSSAPVVKRLVVIIPLGLPPRVSSRTRPVLAVQQISELMAESGPAA